MKENTMQHRLDASNCKAIHLGPKSVIEFMYRIKDFTQSSCSFYNNLKASVDTASRRENVISRNIKSIF